MCECSRGRSAAGLGRWFYFTARVVLLPGVCAVAHSDMVAGFF
jgi:hypothetical protein